MSTHEPRIDTYIAQAAEFAQPILRELRARVHAACPEVEEAIKWGAPSFVYRGKLLGVMAAFKQHAAFNLWQGDRLLEGGSGPREGMGQFGRLRHLQDLPGKREMGLCLRQAMALIDAGEPGRSGRSTSTRPTLVAPDDLLQALAGRPEAQAQFEDFSPSRQRDYVEWILEAKRADTRAKRITQAVEWISEGKSRHWKYERG